MERHITVGVAGHVDHGKTSLVRCLSGTDTDRMKEEKRRGLSIEAGIATLTPDSGEQVALVDVPGHTDFLKNTIRGLSAVDMAILVVAADDGVMPQTSEHLKILEFIRARSGLVVLSKADLVDEETLELAELEVRELIQGTFLEGKPVIPFSAAEGTGTEAVRQAIGAQLVSAKRKGGPFRLYVDQVRSFPGFGTVVSGTVLSGALKQDDRLILLPSGRETRVRSLESHRQKTDRVVAGQRAGISLHRVPLQEVRRGMVLTEPGAFETTSLLNAELQVLSAADRPLANRQKVKVCLGTSVTSARTILMDRASLEPGDTGLVQFRFMQPVAALPRDPFVILPMNRQMILGGGTVLAVPRTKYRSAKADTLLPYLSALQGGDVAAFADALFDMYPYGLFTAVELARRSGFSAKACEAEVSTRVSAGELLYIKGQGALRKAQYCELKGQVMAVAKEILGRDGLKKDLKPGEIADRLPVPLAERVLQRILAELCEAGKLSRSDGGFSLPGFSGALSGQQEKLIGLLLDYARTSGIVPFTGHSVWKIYRNRVSRGEAEKLLDYLLRRKRLVRLNNKRFLSPEGLDMIKERVRAAILKKGGISPADCKEVLGYGRMSGIPVFEYLDEIGFTVRQGNERVLYEASHSEHADPEKRSA